MIFTRKSKFLTHASLLFVVYLLFCFYVNGFTLTRAKASSMTTRVACLVVLFCFLQTAAARAWNTIPRVSRERSAPDDDDLEMTGARDNLRDDGCWPVSPCETRYRCHTA